MVLVLSLSTVCLLDFETAPAVWHFFFNGQSRETTQDDEKHRETGNMCRTPLCVNKLYYVHTVKPV
jgi:hypothetical protein